MSKHHHSDEIAEAKARAKSSRKEIELGSRFVPPEGRSTVRILQTPADADRDSPALYMEYQTHYQFGPHKKSGKCGAKIGDPKPWKHCWLCKKKKEKEDAGKTKEAAKLAPREMLAVQVAVFDHETGELVGPLVWEMSKGKTADAIGYKIKGVISSDRRDYTNHKKGYNVDFTRSGQGLKTKWGDIDHGKSSKVPSGIINRLKPFVDTNMFKYDEQWLKDVYYGKDKDKENDKDMAKRKKKDEDEVSDASDVASDASDQDSDASDKDSDASDDSDKKSKKRKKSKKESSDDSDASDKDSDASDKDSDDSDASDKDSDDSDASDKDSDDSDASDKDSDDSDASDKDSDASDKDSDASDKDSDASDKDSDASDDDEKPKRRKRKPRSDKGKPRGTRAKKKKRTKR